MIAESFRSGKCKSCRFCHICIQSLKVTECVAYTEADED